MSSAMKALLAATAVAVDVVAFVFLQPGDDDEEGASTASRGEATAATRPASEAPTATAPAAPSQPAATRITVRDGKPVGGVRTIEVSKGDTIRFIVSSDQSDEVHVHGYDLEKPVGPSAPARFSSTADIDRMFEVELHGSEAQIASLEVQPG